MIRQKIASSIIAVMIPFLMIMFSVRLLISPLFLEFEYRLPGFPQDTYGFSFEDRLQWSKIAVGYLFNSADITFLGNLQFPDGSSLYNIRELSHMEDVKRLVQSLFIVWYIIIGLIIISGLWAWRKGKIRFFLKAVTKGGMLTIILVLSILLGVALSFNDLFTGFHHLFFQGNTWIFLYSDTLIRLFPMRFWQDAFIWMGILTLLGAFICILLGRIRTNKINPDMNHL